MAIIRRGSALQCRTCAKIFWNNPAEKQNKEAHAAKCGGDLRKGTRTIYKFCPEGGAAHDHSIIAKGEGEKEMSRQTKCDCGQDLKERDLFSPAEH